MEDQKQPTVSAVFVGSTLKSIRHLWRIKRKVSAIYGGLKEKHPPFMED
jgi:hypothetical protein